MPKVSTGGRRGGTTNTGGGGSPLSNLLNSGGNQQSKGGVITAEYDPNKKGDYDANGNPNLIKYQGQEDDKTANYLAGTYRNVDLNDPQYADGYTYHDLPLNKMLLRMGVNDGPTVLSESEFNSYVNQTGSTVVYRGWSGDASADRFLNATHNHVGNGVMGDGYYFSDSKGVARSYGTVLTKMALSPTARVIELSAVQSAMNASSGKLQSALRYAGTTGSGRTYGSNDGEMQMALKMGYNVIKSGNYYVAGTADAFVVSSKKTR